MKKIYSSIIAASLLFASAAANADELFSTTEYATVTSSEPIMTTVNEEVPVEKCTDVKEPVKSGGSGIGDVVGAVAGGALGGILGHQVGGGTGKTVATVGGAVLGTIAGQKVAGNYTQSGSGNETYQVVRKCEVVKTMQTRQVQSGYMNTATFKGKTIRLQTSEPMKQIPITVSYSY